MAEKIFDIGLKQVLKKDAIVKKVPKGCTKIFKLEYYKPMFQVSTSEISKRLKQSLFPPGGNSEFYRRIEKNPDLYGPFWLIVTWWFCLFIGVAIHNLIENKYKEIDISFEKVTGSLEILALFAVGVPLVLCLFLKVLG